MEKPLEATARSQIFLPFFIKRTQGLHRQVLTDAHASIQLVIEYIRYDGRCTAFSTDLSLAGCSCSFLPFRNENDRSVVFGFLDMKILDLRFAFLGQRGGVILASGLHQCRHITQLLLENNYIGNTGCAALSKALSSLPALQKLNLSQNDLTGSALIDLCVALSRNKELNQLDLGNNYLSDQTSIQSICTLLQMNQSISELGLWSSRLSNEGIRMLVQNLATNCDHLTLLNIGKNVLSGDVCRGLSSFLSATTTLEHLNVSYTQLSNTTFSLLVKGLHENTSLVYLDLRYNSLDDASCGEIARLLQNTETCSLSRIHLQDNLITESGAYELSLALENNYTVEELGILDNLASNILFIPHVERINHRLWRNQSFIKQIEGPPEVGGTTVFVVNNQKLISVPPQLHSPKAAHITVINLEGNAIREICATHLEHLARLISFNVSNNLIQSIDFPLCFQNLCVLRLDHNQLSAVPEGIVGLTSLESLDLSHNSITVIPEYIFLLKKLGRLNFSSNKIQSLPTSIQQLSLLKSLELASNHIKTVPVEIVQCPKINVLDLRNNAINMLPASLSRVMWQSFQVGGNPLVCIPPSTVAKGSRSILLYLKDLSSGADYFYRVKLLFTGQANVGKTTLLSALRSEVGNVNKVLRLLTGKGRRTSTSGIALQDWKPIDSLITFSTWDFGGQLIYYSTHQFFLSKRSMYLVVFSMAQGLRENRLVSWLNSIQARAPGVPVLLVGTHLDDKRCTPQYINQLKGSIRRTMAAWERSFQASERLKIIKSNDDWFHQVSSITGTGILELRKLLMNIAADQPWMREKIPRLYLNLLDVVRIHRRTHPIPMVSWADVYHWSGFEDEGQFERAMSLLHDLGELVCFQESITLRDIVILSPQWLTKMFATIICPKGGDGEDAEGHFNNDDHSLIHLSQLDSIWKDYDPNHFQYFMTLLESFEVWIPLADTQQFLVPCLLRRREIDEDPGLEWEALHFGRSFVLPFPLHGLFERCLVQLLKLYEPIKYWKDEAIVGRDGVSILIQLSPTPSPRNQHECTLSFFVAGDSPIQQKDKEEAESRANGFRSAISAIMFIVHNFLQDWYSFSLRDQIDIVVLCKECCKSSHIGGSFSMQDLISQKFEDGNNESERGHVTCSVCHSSLSILEDLIPEMINPIQSQGDYQNEITEVKYIAEGSRSRVYLGTFKDHRKNNEYIAVKKLKVRKITIDWFLEFLQEINMLQKVNHPNLVGIIGAYLRPSLCIILEYVGGGTLDSAIQKFSGPTDYSLLYHVMKDITQGMLHLHHELSIPVLHRDLKSMNILVVSLEAPFPTPCVKIADLGSSCLSLGKVGVGIGDNPRYKAPELFIAHYQYSKACDVYCFGILMYELIARRIPWSDIVWPSLIEEKIAKGERPELGDVDVSDPYFELLSECWAQKDTSRPSFIEIAQKIDAILDASELESKSLLMP